MGKILGIIAGVLLTGGGLVSVIIGIQLLWMVLK